ncbi:MAG: GxxExxY protein [Panacagrimonas sp.]
MDTEKGNSLLHGEIADAILRCFFEVHTELGHGFLEGIYESALEIVLQGNGLTVQRQLPVAVRFRGQKLGDFKLDMVVERSVVVEVKAVAALNAPNEAQLLNYLKATGLRVGLLLNFGPKAQFKRRVV